MFLVEKLIQVALEEDIGSGDLTTNCLIEKNILGKGFIFAKESIILAGIEVASKVFNFLDPKISIFPYFSDGDKVERGDIILEIEGSLNFILMAERTALNFLQRLSGISTHTKRYIKELGNSKIKVIDTRKTIPCWRVLEKYAVKVGGGHNHRMGLYDGVLIKDNHISASGGILPAVNKIRKKIPHLMKIEVEVTSLNEIKDCIKAGVDVIMLDNMNIDQIKKAVEIIDNNALIEVSGNITIEKLKKLSSTGINFISIGALTHSAPSVDLSMKIK